MGLARRFDAWLFGPGSARRLAAIRIGLFTVVGVRLARGLYVDWARTPAALYHPVSFMRLLPGPPGPGVVAVVQALGIVAAVSAVAGYRTRLSAVVASAAAFVLVGALVGYGHDGMNEVPVLLVAAVVAVSPCGDAWSLDARRRPAGTVDPNPARYGWAVRLAMLLVAGGYLFAGIAKLMFSGLAWVTSDNMRWILYAASDAQRAANPVALFIADRPLLAHLTAAALLVAELCAPVLVFRPASRWVLLPALVGLHVMTWLALRLDYFPWVAVDLVVFVDWAPVVERTLARARASDGGLQASDGGLRASDGGLRASDGGLEAAGGALRPGGRAPG